MTIRLVVAWSFSSLYKLLLRLMVWKFNSKMALILFHMVATCVVKCDDGFLDSDEYVVPDSDENSALDI